MKKIGALLITFLLAIHVATVSAEVFSNELPGGKNYINPENIIVQGEQMITIENIFVKSDQSYTLSFPNRDMLGEDIYVLIEGEETYIEEYPIDTICSEEYNMISCTFTTTPTETSIAFEIQGELIELFYSYYDFENFQLEEGTIRTEYEEYISPYNDSLGPEFSGSGAFITSYNSALSIQEIVSSHIVAYDEIDGDVSDQITLLSDAYTGNEAIVGEYLVELSVSDNSGNESLFDLFILVKDEIAPIITGANEIFISVEVKNRIEDIINIFIDYDDEYDSNPTLTITHDDYTTNILAIGSYLVSIEVVDSSGNVSAKDFTIHLEDIDPPQLLSSTTIDVDVSNPTSMDQIIESLIAIDNYDETVDITINTDYYTLNQYTIGIYFVDIILSDDSNNQTERTLKIQVNDSGNPVIEGPLEITTSYTEILSLEEIKQLYTLTDNYDELDNSSLFVISDGYSENRNTPGVYEILFQAIDSSGNISQHILEITVIDNVGPVIFIDQYIVVIEMGSSFGENDMLKLLQLSNEIAHSNYQVTILQNEYKGNEDNAGDYIYKVKLTDSEGSELVREFKITVQEEEEKTIYTESIVYTLIGFAIITGAFFYKKYK